MDLGHLQLGGGVVGLPDERLRVLRERRLRLAGRPARKSP
jgi:hypothetical protein